MICGCTPQIRNPDLVLNYPNDDAPSALGWDGRDLMIGRGNFIINVRNIETEPYAGNYEDFGAEGSFSFGKDAFALRRKPMNICGLAWEGGCCGNGFLWVLNSERKEIIKYNNENAIQKILPTPGNSPRGLAFDGKDLWLADADTGKIYKISAADGSVLSAYDSPVAAPVSIATDCTNVWIIGRDSCTTVNQNCDSPKLIQIDSQNGKVIDKVWLPIKLVKPTAMVYANGDMWIADGNNNRIFKISID
jgi:hypothetical protein